MFTAKWTERGKEVGAAVWSTRHVAEHSGWCASKREQINRNSDYYSSVKCLSCIELEHLLKEANKEISSLQYINEWLYKELNNGATTNIECEWARTAPRAQISTSNWNQNSYIGKPRTQPTPQPVRTTNRYSILAELHDPAAEHEANPRGGKGTRNGPTPYHTNKEKQLQFKTNGRSNTK